MWNTLAARRLRGSEPDGMNCQAGPSGGWKNFCSNVSLQDVIERMAESMEETTLFNLCHPGNGAYLYTLIQRVAIRIKE